MKLSITFIITGSVILLGFSSCFIGHKTIKGEGAIVTETLQLSSIERINLLGAEDVIIQQGLTQEIKAVGHANIIRKLQKNVKNGLWNIVLEQGSYSNYSLTIYITVPSIKEIELLGSGNIKVGSFTGQKKLTAILMGSGDISLSQLQGTERLSLSLTGSGDISCHSLQSEINELTAELTGSGDINCSGINSKNAQVKLIGSGDCSVNVESTLDAYLSGSGDIHYKGNPSVKKKIEGSGEIVQEK